jgi:hypothetical protein
MAVPRRVLDEQLENGLGDDLEEVLVALLL